MNREIHIVPAKGFVSVDGTGYDKLDLSALAGNQFADPSIHLVTWDGRDGVIQRKSKVPGRFDISHFDDPADLAPFIPVWEAEKQKRADALYDQLIVAAEIDNQIFDQEAESKRRADAAAEATKQLEGIYPTG